MIRFATNSKTKMCIPQEKKRRKKHNAPQQCPLSKSHSTSSNFMLTCAIPVTLSHSSGSMNPFWNDDKNELDVELYLSKNKFRPRLPSWSETTTCPGCGPTMLRTLQWLLWQPIWKGWCKCCLMLGWNLSGLCGKKTQNYCLFFT